MKLRLVHHSQTRPVASPANEGFEERGTLKKTRMVVKRRRADRSLVEQMDRLRKKIGPISVRVVELIREGRRR